MCDFKKWVSSPYTSLAFEDFMVLIIFATSIQVINSSLNTGSSMLSGCEKMCDVPKPFQSLFKVIFYQKLAVV